MKINKRKTIIVLISIAVLMYLVIAGMAGTSTNLGSQHFSTPEAAFYHAFQTEPYMTMPCGDHVHMCGRDESNPYDKNGSDIHVVAEEDPAGWHIIEKTSLYAVRANLGPEIWDGLTIETQAKCHFNLINIVGMLPAGADTEYILHKVTDSAGTKFAICTRSYSVGDVFFIFGLADIQQSEYELSFDSERIYP